MSQAADKYLSNNTLSFVISLSIGKRTTVELRNDTYVTGRIIEVKWDFQTYYLGKISDCCDTI